MDSFEWNKVVGGVLGAILFALVVRTAAETIYHVEPLEEPAYIVEGVEEEVPEAVAEAELPEPPPDFATLIPAADAEAGEAVAERCALCHTWTIGPNLYGIIGRPRGAHPGFMYSPAMTEAGGEWTYQEIFDFLESPPLYIPGNRMAFAGLPREQDRLDLLAYVREWADTPPPLPPPNPQAAAAESASAGATAADTNAGEAPPQ